MYKTIQKTWPVDGDLPVRAFRLAMRRRVLTGELYDRIAFPFHYEKSDAGEYVPLRQRRPSVRSNLCRVVVDDAVALLFSEGNFPEVEIGDAVQRAQLRRVCGELALNRVMIAAATRGAVGSVAILLRVLESRLFLQVMDTDMLTPRWSKTAPDMLLSVTEKYKVGGQALQDAGYRIAAEDIGADFWFQRVWDADSETWYLPWKVADVDAVPAVDADNTLAHRLGFVPIAWVRNLPGGDGVDGACTFPDEAIDTQIEIDYQLSQAGRALKFMGDPTLVIRGEFNAGSDGGIVKGAGNALMLPEDGEASLLQIDGAASAAVLDYVKHLREVALEAMHGNRASNDKTSAAQSGRALVLLNQPLIWLADRLRISYGEGAILALLRMVVQASNQIALRFADGSAVGRFDPSLPLSLRWPEWFAPSAQERQCRAATLSLLCGSGLLSRATAIRILCADYDIEDAAAELALADAERGTGGKTGSAAIDRIDPIDPNGQ